TLVLAPAALAEPVPVTPDSPSDADTIPPATASCPTPSPPAAATGEPTYMMSDRTHRTITTQEYDPFASYGIEISAGGGVSGFANESAREATTAGGSWDVRATVGT